jgi:hypothetical protein
MNPVFDRSINLNETIGTHQGDLIFQSLTWNDGDFEKETQNESNVIEKDYEIYISGVNTRGNTVSIRITGFKPYFYVLVPDSWSSLAAKIFFEHTRKKMHSEIIVQFTWLFSQVRECI